MNGKDESRLNMFFVVIKFSDNNNRKIAVMPGLETALAAFKTTAGAIESTAQQYLTATTGVTVGKGQSKRTIVRFVISVKGALFAWASKTKKPEIKERLKFSKSELLRTRDETLTLICRNIYDLALANKAELADYGITDAQLAAFQAAINDYTNAVPAPRNAVSLRRNYRATIKALFKTANDLLNDEIDKLIPLVANGDEGFLEEYKACRVVIDTGRSLTRLKVIAADAKTGAPLREMTVEVKALELTGLTGRTGSVIFKPMKPGSWKIRFFKAGYQEEIRDIEVLIGQTAVAEVVLTPV